MSTDTARRTGIFVFGVVFAVCIVAACVILLSRGGQHSMAKGMAIGGGISIVALVALRIVAARRPDRISSAARNATNLSDERDAAILGKAFAATGYAAILLTGLGFVAAALGSDAVIVMGVLLALLVLVFSGGYADARRRL